MDRRRFLTAATTLPLAAQLPGIALAQERSFTPTPGRWRTFEIVTRIEIADAARRHASVGAGAVGDERVADLAGQHVDDERQRG